MNEDYICEVCAAFARLDRETPKGHSFFDVCECAGYRRFVWYGTVPTTITEAEKICRALKKLAGLSSKRGPKKKQVTLDDFLRALKELPPDAGITHLAGALGVSTRQIPPSMKKLFLDEQEARRSGTKSRLRYPRLRRSRRR